MANEFDSNFTFLLKKEKKHGIGGYSYETKYL